MPQVFCAIGTNIARKEYSIICNISVYSCVYRVNGRPFCSEFLFSSLRYRFCSHRYHGLRSRIAFWHQSMGELFPAIFATFRNTHLSTIPTLLSDCLQGCQSRQDFNFSLKVSLFILHTTLQLLQSLFVCSNKCNTLEEKKVCAVFMIHCTETKKTHKIGRGERAGRKCYAARRRLWQLAFHPVFKHDHLERVQALLLLDMVRWHVVWPSSFQAYWTLHISVGLLGRS